MIKKYNLTVRDYGKKGWYISDGRSNYLHCNGKIVNGTTLNGGAYLRKELAEQALENYNNNGEVMKRVSIEDDNGKKYEFETDREDVVLLKVVKDRVANSRIIGYTDRDFIDPLTWSLRGTCLRGQTTINLTPYDQFKDLKRVCNEGAIIEAKIVATWCVMSCPTWESDQYRIKGGISIESWDKHKEAIKEFWNGAEIEYSGKYTPWYTSYENKPDWSDYNYRVKPEPKVEELSVKDLEQMLGYKIKIVREGV